MNRTMGAPGSLRAAVVGVGCFGRHHARIYDELRPQGVELIGLVDIDPVGPRSLAERLGVPLVGSVQDLPGRVDLVSIATPTSVHARVAEPLLRAGVHCLVEKPAGGSSAAVAGMLEAARRGSALLQVGMVERFNPVLDALAALSGDPVYVEVQRMSPPTMRITDVGVVLDLMIHDLDLLSQVVGREVVDVRATGVRLMGGHEDVASARLVFEGGCVAQVVASRVAETRERTLRVFTRSGYLVLDCDRQEARKVVPLPGRGPGGDEWALRVEDLARREPGESTAAALVAGPEDGFASRKIPLPRREPLRAELESWVENVRMRAQPRVGGEAAQRALFIAERILSDIGRRLGPSPQNG